MYKTARDNEGNNIDKSQYVSIMNIDDTLFKALADLKIAGQIQKENLLNNLGVESNMKLYSHAKTGKLDNLRPPNDSFLKLIICTGNETSKDGFNLKAYNNENK